MCLTYLGVWRIGPQVAAPGIDIESKLLSSQRDVDEVESLFVVQRSAKCRLPLSYSIAEYGIGDLLPFRVQAKNCSWTLDEVNDGAGT